MTSKIKMNLTPENQARTPAQRHRQGSRGSIGLSATPSQSNSLSPDDGYDYHDTGPAPEDEPTKERENDNLTKARPPSHSDPKGVEGAGRILEEVKTNVYERHLGHRRAKVPDPENPTITFSDGGPIPTQPAPKVQAKPAPKVQGSLWRRFKGPSRTITLETGNEKKIRHVKLHWEKDKQGGEERFLLNAILQNPDARSEPQNHVIWQHSNIDNLRIDLLENIVTQSRSQGLQNSEVGLTRRLLKRVRRRAERAVVGGSFLDPLALRYDILDDSKYSVDKCCIFLGFPYFAVQKAKAKRGFAKGSPEHPTRTLLQSAYRLNDTLEQDKFQSIRMLKQETLKSCIDATEDDKTQISRKVTEELIHVPQLWALTLGLDRLITNSPISDEALQGRSIKVKDSANVRQSQRCSLVRISFMNHGRVEDLTYPIEQCASWFGLLNKHQQIRAILKQEKERADPKDYMLEIQGRIIEDNIWASVQKMAQGEVLKIWMKTPKPSKKANPKISVKNADTDSESGSKTAHESDEASLLDEEPLSDAPAAFDKLVDVPVISSFLAWPILDEFGEPDESPLEDKLNRFLNAIYRSLPVRLAGRADEAPTDNARAGYNTKAGLGARPKLTFDGKTLTDIENSFRSVSSDHVGEDTSVAQKITRAYIKLFYYFLPKDVDEQSAPVQLFWGAVVELEVKDPQEFLQAGRLTLCHRATLSISKRFSKRSLKLTLGRSGSISACSINVLDKQTMGNRSKRDTYRKARYF